MFAENTANNVGLAASPWKARAILLIDLDAFFASVEQLDHPAWRGKPVIVGGSVEKRGVVSTASYEAREYGVHSAMPSAVAHRLCPHAIWTTGHFRRYHEVSKKVMAIIRDETPYIQQVSIDEAFADVTPTTVNTEHPVSVARRIQERVAQLGVTCSIGVGATKSIAKIASDIDKPHGLTVVLPGSELNFIDQLPIRCLSGIGAATETKLKERGFNTLGDLYRANTDEIVRAFGKTGQMLVNRVHGWEDEPIVSLNKVKSISSETSFAHDLTNRVDIQAAIDTMASKVGRRLRRKRLVGTTLVLKVRYANLSFRSTQVHLNVPSNDEFFFREKLHTMLDDLWTQGMELRLVGVAVAGLKKEDKYEQLSLFDTEGFSASSGKSHEDLLAATDKVKERFGESALKFGRELRLETDTFGSFIAD